MNLRDELEEWVGSNLDNVPDDFCDSLWGFLQEKIGPVQEKLMNDISLLRSENNQMKRKLEALIDENYRRANRANNTPT